MQSIRGMQALEAVVRLGTVNAAAQELGVTPGAITHRIRDLEQVAKTALLVRVGGRFLPSERGQQVLRELGGAFAQLRLAQRALVPEDDRKTTRILAPSSFATLWLLPHLPEFERNYPSSCIKLQPTDSPWRSPEASGFDMIIQDAPQRPDQRDWLPLFEDRVLVLGAPDLIERIGDVSRLGQMSVAAIQTDSDEPLTAEAYSWGNWCRDRGVAGSALRMTIRVTQSHMAITLAAQGHGLVLTSRSLVSSFLRDGRLKELPGSEVTGPTYWLSTLNRGAARQGQVFLGWLQETLAAEELGLARA
ncbi:LysR family transcriptional regulator [Paracoccus aminophilus]|uniref:Transcriptional regulator, LysR family n=1 Tax=Paracoccus aminophilus JCM 7686 TaxID=1367847 RepID=S5XNE9_PARAH|nr:LysR family transcriptional regulator [Paracoccus aminophilus]AGT08849.1 transcriptional regulator, LysR family [Paracoccus aminophilus JCM 7686]